MMSCFFFLMILRPPRTTRTDTRFPYTTLFRSLGIPLVGGHYAAAAVDIARPSLAHRPLPGGMAQLQSYDAVVIDTVASLGASAFMSGVGGDNVFHLTRSARPLVDRLLTVGPTLGALRTLRDICAITGDRKSTRLNSSH